MRHNKDDTTLVLVTCNASHCGHCIHISEAKAMQSSIDLIISEQAASDYELAEAATRAAFIRLLVSLQNTDLAKIPVCRAQASRRI